MDHKQHLKTVPYSTPLFANALIAYPFSQPNSISYLMLSGQQVEAEMFNKKHTTKFICPSFYNETDDCCFIVLEGENFSEYLHSKINARTNDAIMTQEQIWSLIICICEVFAILKQHGFADKLTHFKEYSIRKIKEKNLYKLIFHQSMISQLDFATKDGSKWWDDLYLSPQELNNQFVPEKSIIFSFGCLLLNLCSISDKNRSIYNRNQFTVSEQIIKQKIQIARRIYGYSKLLCNFILECLLINPDERYNFEELKEFLYRKLERIYLKQSDLLSQILEKDNGKGISYEIWLPPNYTSRQTYQYDNWAHKSHSRTKSQKSLQNKDNKHQKQATKKFQKSSVQAQKPNQMDEAKKLKRKPSLKFQGSKGKSKSPKKESQVSQKLVQQTESQTSQQDKSQDENQPKQNIFQNIQYRGTFGARTITAQNEQNYERTKKKTKQIKGQEDQQSYNKKVNTNKQKQFTHNSRAQKKLQKQYVYGDETNIQILSRSKGPIKLEIYCNEIPSNKAAEHNFNPTQNQMQYQKEHKYYSHSQQPDTPKGFGHYHYHNPIDYQPNFKSHVEQSTYFSPNEQSRKYNSNPQSNTEMRILRLQDCLRPLEQLKLISSIGVWVEGDLYYGNFLNGRRHGLALEIFANNQYYYGHFKQDLFSGEGFYFWNSREYFFGKFELGQKIWGHLYGEIQYKGGFKNNKRHGEGTCQYSTGEIYQGSWFNGKRHGQGTIMEPDGTKFVGNWMKGKRKGEGYLQTDSLRIAGYWNDQVIEGQSLIQYKNGDVFRGKTGPTLEKLEGQYISKSGRVFKGIFENDQPKKGQLKYSNGDRYVGELENMRRHGYGEYYYSTGQVYKGLWQNNQKKN